MKLFATSLLAALLALPALSSFAADEAVPAVAATPAPVVAAAAPAKSAKPDLVKGEATFTAVCASCHGADGNSGIPAYPKLAQQHPEYLIKQLEEFKSGKRKDPVMQVFAATLTDDDMKNVAYWATAIKAKTGFSKEKDLVTMGERIYRGGIANRQIAACAGCHSPNGAGLPSQYPRLAGQHAEYTVAQLTAFRDGVRGNNLTMAEVTSKLNDKEIRAVADYIAGLR